MKSRKAVEGRRRTVKFAAKLCLSTHFSTFFFTKNGTFVLRYIDLIRVKNVEHFAVFRLGQVVNNK